MIKLEKYSARWCQPCRALSATLSEINLETANIMLIEHDVDLMPRTDIAALGIRGVPTLILYDDGVEIARKTGALTADELKAFLKLPKT